VLWSDNPQTDKLRGDAIYQMVQRYHVQSQWPSDYAGELEVNKEV